MLSEGIADECIKRIMVISCHVDTVNSVCTWIKLIPEQRQSSPAVWHQSCLDNQESPGDPPWSTECEHCPPNRHVHKVTQCECACLDVSQCVYSVYCVTWWTRYSSSWRMLTLCSVVVLLLLNCSNRRFIIYTTPHIKLGGMWAYTYYRGRTYISTHISRSWVMSCCEWDEPKKRKKLWVKQFEYSEFKLILDL